jgi:hypothetical protein
MSDNPETVGPRLYGHDNVVRGSDQGRAVVDKDFAGRYRKVDALFPMNLAKWL